ncbi:golgin subfamily B member 1-like isoform X1 [Pleurodeles waltl]|uniref:golgin subfamily B member 1-like isoform X1 n=1 Tax=Pleurodeles waltl TaxID=8319 RepID=UPI00370965CE
MWKWIAPDGSSPGTAAPPGMQVDTSTMSVTEISEQLAQTQQLVVQLKELIREKDQQIQNKDQQLKEEKEASDSKLSKAKLQNKAKVASLSSQLEELKKQIPTSGLQLKKTDLKKSSGDGDHENAAANRGKILVLRRKVEELESQVTQKNEELQKKIAELEAQQQRGSEMDAILAQKEKKLSEKEAYIIELQMAVGSNSQPKFVPPLEDQKDQVSLSDSVSQDVQMIIHNLTRKLGHSEEKYSLLQEQTESLKNLLNKEKNHFQEREAMYMENIRMFQNIIQEKEKDLLAQAQNHEQELFRLAAKSDASADLEQLLKALKQKLHEKEEVLLGKNQVIDVLQKELDVKDQHLKEVNERCKRLESEKENLQSKLDAEKHVMRAQLRDMMDKHQTELKLVNVKHKAEVQEIEEKHETEIQEKDQILLQLQKQIEELNSSGQSSSEKAVLINDSDKGKIERLEAQVKLKSEEASKSESKFFKLKAWSKSRIKQLEDDLKSSSSNNNSMSVLSERLSDLETENHQLQAKLETFSELKTQNEELHAKLELYEEQQRKLQADLEQVTKRAASQTSESGSADELQHQVLEWHDMMPESEEALEHLREEKSAIALRMVQIEEEREAIVSGQQDLEEELTSVQGMGRLPQSRRKGIQATKKSQGNYGHDGQRYEDPNSTLDSVDSAEGENMGGWWPEYSAPNSGLQTVVEELELERNQLQEQIMALEERCHDLEDRLQLQVRIETLQVTYGVDEECQAVRFKQNDNERLQTQLIQLRAQLSREAEMHQALSSSLNEQLKGLNERKIFLETSLMEKEQKLSETTGKLEQINILRHSAEEQTVLNKELSERNVQMELQLEDAKTKLNCCEAECAEMKATNNDLTEKVNTLKEKTAKQDLALEAIQRELDQTNEELERLNTCHLEERSQLIRDIQRCERENDNLKEVLEEKEKELASFSSNIIEFSEQLSVLKQELQSKEEEMRVMEESIGKAQRENHLLRESQSLDIQESSMKMSALSEKLEEMVIELKQTKDQNEVQSKEAKELNNQVNEYAETIKDLRSQIQTHALVHRNHLTECEVQISLLKEQNCLYAQKLLEAETKSKQESLNLLAHVEENSSLKEKLGSLLEEKESNTQNFESQLASIKDHNNILISEVTKKDEELIKLSKCLEEHIHLQETVKLIQQDKLDTVKSLEGSLKTAKQQSEDIKLKFVEKLEAAEQKNGELKRQIEEQHEAIDKMDVLKQDLDRHNKHLKLTLEEKEASLSDQIKVVSDLTGSLTTLENKQQQLMNENTSILKQLDEKESEILKCGNTITELEKKLLINEEQMFEFQQTITLLCRDKEELIKNFDHVSMLLEQKDTSLSSELLEKNKECSFLSEQLSSNQESIQSLKKQISDMGVKLVEAKEVALEKENALKNKLAECTTLQEQLNQSLKKIELFQKQILELKADVDLKCKDLREKCIEFEENKCLMNKLQNELQYTKTENERLARWVEERDSKLMQKDQEIQDLCQLNNNHSKENAALNARLDVQCKEIDKLKIENEEVLIKLNNQLSAYESIHTQMSQSQSEFLSLKQQLHTQDKENQKLKADLEITYVKLTQKTEETEVLSSHLSQQAHTVLALRDQIDSLNIEKQKMHDIYDEKMAILAQKEAEIQELKAKQLEEEGQSSQFMSDLQSQLQSYVLETAQLQQTSRDRENEMLKLTQEIKTYKDKSEEYDLLKVQLSENMEVISGLHFQIKNLNAKSEELNNLVIEKDQCLKKKVDDYVNLKTKYSEIEGISSMHQKQIETLMHEESQMKSNVLEKEKMLKNALDYTEELKLKLQDKELVCETLRQQIKRLETEATDLKQELSNQTVELGSIKFSMLEKDSIIKNLNDIAHKEDNYSSQQLEQHRLLVSQLQRQLLDTENELISSKELSTEKEQACSQLQEQCAVQLEQMSELNKALREKEDYISELLKSMNEKDISVQLAENKVHALTNEIKLLREEIDKCMSEMKQTNSVVKEKEECICAKQKTIDSLNVNLEAVEMEYQSKMEQIHAWQHEIQQKDLNVKSLEEKCFKQLQLIENLKSELNVLNSVSSKNIHDKSILIDTLQLQVADVVKERNSLLEDIRMLTNEKESLTTTFQNQIQQQSDELKTLQEKMKNTLKDSDVEINSKVLQLKNEKEQLEMQVSVDSEELGALKLKFESLQVILCESEGKYNVELASLSQQNALLRDQLNHLESELTSRANTVQFLQHSLCLLDEKMNGCELFTDDQLIEGSRKTPMFDNIQVENDTRLEKLSVLIANIVANNNEINHLKTVLSIKEKECFESEENHCKMLNLQKEKYQLEIKGLLEEMQSIKEALKQQQIFSEKNELLVSNLSMNTSIMQEQIDNKDKELQIKNEMLKKEGDKILDLHEEVRRKEEEIHSLTSQAVQQKDLISALSCQLKEKDASVSRVMESMSNEMVKFSEEKSILKTQIEHLESVRNTQEVGMNMDLEKCRQDLDHYKKLLSEKETEIAGVINEKDQMQLLLEKITKEKDNLKRKLQASLVIRKDLLKKNEMLAQTGQDEIDKEKQKTDTLLKTIDELTHHLESSKIEKNEHESCQKLLKFQLLEKDSEKNNLNEIIAAKESLLEECQKNIKELNNIIVQKENELQEHLQIIQERDILLNKLQNDLQERERLFEKCFGQPSNLEAIKSGIDGKEDQQKFNSNKQFLAGDSCELTKQSCSKIHQQHLEQDEKEIIQTKLCASHFDEKKTLTWLEQDNYVNDSEQTYDHNTVNDRNQIECKECECKHMPILSLQDGITYHEAIHSEKESSINQSKLESAELMSEIGRKEMQLVELNIKYDQLQKAFEELKNNASEKSVEISVKAEDICKLGYSESGTDHKETQDKEIPFSEHGHQEEKVEASVVENDSICIMPEKSTIPMEDVKREQDGIVSVLDTSEIHTCHMKMQESKINEFLTKFTSTEINAVTLNEIVQCPKEQVKVQLKDLLLQIEMLKDSLQKKENSISKKDRLIANLENQIQQQNKIVQGHVGTVNTKEYACQHQEAKIGEESKSTEHLQKKLHAALISRRDVIKENTILKEELDALSLEKHKLLDKISNLEHLLAKLDKDVISSLHKEKSVLVSENDRILIENENLSAACESLKSTMETIVQEKEAFSIQLNTLQESQMVELSSWKAKHSELNKEYESLLQAYENISDEMDKMRQIIELTRKEKQEVLQRIIDLEYKKVELEKEIHNSHEENTNLNVHLRELIKSKEAEIGKLLSETESLNSLLKSTVEQSVLSELTMTNTRLTEENSELKEITANLKFDLEKKQKENDCLQNDIFASKSNLVELQSEIEAYKADILCKFDDISSERQSFLNQITCLTNDISEKREHLTTIEQDRNVTLEKLKEFSDLLDQKTTLNCKLENEVKHFKQHTISLIEKVRILEDDRCLLQEELENVQELSDKIKYEKEFLETEILNNIKQIDHLTDTLKAVQLQNSTLTEQLEDLRKEKNTAVHEQKLQQLHLVKDSEDNVKEARSKNKSRELQDLLKEKQQQIHQLQSDSIHFQELIYSLERTVKISQSDSEKYKKDLQTANNDLNKSHEEAEVLNENLNSYICLLNEANSSIASLTAMNTTLQEELRDSRNELKLQKSECEKIKGSYDELKIVYEELSHLRKSHYALNKENEKLAFKCEEIKNDVDLNDKNLQSGLNTDMLAGCSQSRSFLQNNSDRVIDEEIISENQFTDAILNQESQMKQRNLKIFLQDELNEKVARVKEIESKCFALEEDLNQNELRSFQEQLEIANETDMLKKPVPSLQFERDNKVIEPKCVDQNYQSLSEQHKGLLVESRVKNIDLKKEVRNLLNEIDDLHSENALLRAQLIRYREDLNQVLSLKDHQLKELLKQQLDRIKILEQDKCYLQKEQKELQRIKTLNKEKIELLEHDHEKVLAKNKDLESLISILNRGNIVSESKEKSKKTDFDDLSPVSGAFETEAQEFLRRKKQHEDKSKFLEHMHKVMASQHDTGSVENKIEGQDEVNEKWMVEVKKQNADLKSENKSFAKAMAALQNDRDQLIEDLKVLQSKYAVELKSEQVRGDHLESRLNDLKSRLCRLMEANNFEVVPDANDKDTLNQLDSKIKDLQYALANRDHEITRLSSECGNYALQIDAFSKAMASLQDDRDGLLQQIRNWKKIHEAKQGNTSITGPFDASSNVNVLQNNIGSLGHASPGLFNSEVVQLKSRVDELERALQQAKAYQERTDYDVSSYQTELSKLRAEKNSLLTEMQALRDHCHRTFVERDSQIAELQKFHQEIMSKESASLTNIYAMKALETSALAGTANIPDQVKQLLAEKSQLQNEMQRCLQEMHQRDQCFQKMNARGEMRTEVPPGAPQERASVIVEIDNMELNDLRKRLIEIEQHYESSQQELTQLAEKLEEERTRREAAEDALLLAEQQDERHGEKSFRHVARDYEYAVQMESDDEREALIIDPREHIVVRKVKGGALSVRRWLRGRSIYCSKLLTSRAKSRYLFLTYLLTLHIVVFMCLSGVI